MRDDDTDFYPWTPVPAAAIRAKEVAVLDVDHALWPQGVTEEQC